MDEGGLRGYALRICDWIVRLASLNGLWVGFSLLGGGVFGFFPALYAMFAVMKRWCMNDKVPLAKTFFQEWKASFWRANAVGYTVASIGAVLMFDYVILISINSFGSTAMAAILLFFLVVYGLTILFVGPAIVQFDGPLFPFLKSVAFLAVASLPYALMMALFLFLAAILFVLIPPAAICFSGSVFAWITTHFGLKAFQRTKQIPETRLRGAHNR